MADIPSLEAPPWVRDFAKSRLEQARRAFPSVIGPVRRTTDPLHRSMDLTSTSTRAWLTRCVDHAEQNVRAPWTSHSNSR